MRDARNVAHLPPEIELSIFPIPQSVEPPTSARAPKLKVPALISMWASTRMIVLTAAVAALYTAAEVALQSASFVIIPGVVEFKVSDVLTMALGVLFGPAGAWGVGIGNVFGDLFTGSLAVGSIFGFLSTMAVAYVGYTMWKYFERHWHSPEGSSSRRPAPVIAYLAIGIPAAGSSAVILAWGLDLLGIAPFKIISDTLISNFIVGNWIGAILFFLVYDRFKSMDLTWDSIMSEASIGRPIAFKIGAILVVVGSFVGWVLGAFVLPVSSITSVVSIPFAAIIVGCLLL